MYKKCLDDIYIYDFFIKYLVESLFETFLDLSSISFIHKENWCENCKKKLCTVVDIPICIIQV